MECVSEAVIPQQGNEWTYIVNAHVDEDASGLCRERDEETWETITQAGGPKTR